MNCHYSPARIRPSLGLTMSGYVKERRLASLTARFGSVENKEQDSDKLLNLYWNRAELKKEFAGMRKEQFRLRDRIKQQEGATARLQQKLDHVEDLLADPDWVHNVIVFYQLRGLAAKCQTKLEKFGEQLKQQREQKQHNGILVKWNEKRTAEARSIERQLLMRRDAAQQLEDQLGAERQRLIKMSGFLKVFRRRSVTVVLDNLAAKIDAVGQEEAALIQELEEIRNRKPPDNEGLDIQSKRSINLMILSFAQQLFLHFADDDLAAPAKEATEKSAGAINYGGRHECDQMLNRINNRLATLDQVTDFAEILRNRAKLLGQTAQFRDNSEAVPVSGSVATVYAFDANGLVLDVDANILGDNYWGISKILSR